jgi:hypothetical protein
METRRGHHLRGLMCRVEQLSRWRVHGWWHACKDKAPVHTTTVAVLCPAALSSP